jgi:hypothetical protein
VKVTASFRAQAGSYFTYNFTFLHPTILKNCADEGNMEYHRRGKMTNCPVCNSKVDEKAKFCPACGIPLTSATTEWVVAMQEKIKATRHNDNIFSVVAICGILIAVLIPWITRFIRYNNMDVMSWSLTAVGGLLFLGSAFGIWFDNNNVKELIEQLEKGPDEAGKEKKEEDDTFKNPGLK